MKNQILKPETEKNLRELPVGAQYNNFVRANNEQALLFFREKRKILILNKNKAGWAENEQELITGKKFIYF